MSGPQRTNTILICAVLTALVGLWRATEASNAEPSYVDTSDFRLDSNQFFRRLYIGRQSTLAFRCEENKCEQSKEEVQAMLEKYKNSKSIEISGMWTLFSNSSQFKGEIPKNLKHFTF